MQLSENTEEYLEILWTLEEDGIKPAKVSDIAQRLKISPPSVVEMLDKLEGMGVVRYRGEIGISFTKKGRNIAKKIVRNHRLAELLITGILKIKMDETAACGIEHHISEDIADAVNRILKNPKKCPHGKPIP